MALQPGEILDGKYRIIRLVGEGGMGAVYEGENTRIKRKVAIKVLHSSVAEKVDVVARFEREAQAAGRIGSEHIVEVLDLGTLPSQERFMVMEFLEGEDLTSRIKKRRRLTPHECIPLLHQVLDGLAAAHEAKIVHRDLKPDNIFILNSRSGRPDFVKILDFGVSKFSALDAEMSMTRTGAVMGTPYYMSPEQAKGGQVDARSDIYAMGVVLYQMITGRVPFNASSFNELLFKIALESPEPIEQIVNDCPPAFVAIVNRAMAREADGRFQSCREFQQALAHWQATAGAQPQPARTEAMPMMQDMRPPQPSHHPTNTPLPQPPPRPAAGRPMHHSAGEHPGAATQRVENPLAEHPGAATQAWSPQAGTPMHGTPIPGTRTPSGPLGVSHSALAVTPPPRTKKKNTGMVVALLAVTAGIVGAGGFGIYVLTRPTEPITASGGPDLPDKVDPGSGASVPKPVPAADPTPKPDPQPDPAPVEPSSTGKATEPPTPPPEDEPHPKGKRTPQPGPGPAPQPIDQPKPTPVPVPQPSSKPGRKVETKL